LLIDLNSLAFCLCFPQATAPTNLTGTGGSLKSMKDKDGKDVPSTLQTIGDHSAGSALFLFCRLLCDWYKFVQYFRNAKAAYVKCFLLIFFHLRSLLANQILKSLCPVCLTGYLLKRSAKNGDWNKRWFVLNEKTHRVSL
jgi:hypothetical protein